jgi:hypothetical protein
MATMLSGAAVMDAALLLIGETICDNKKQAVSKFSNSFFSWKRVLSAAANQGAFGCCRDHEAE